MILKLILYFVAFLLAVVCVHPGRFAVHYEFIDQDELFYNLAAAAAKNATRRELAACEYERVLQDASDAESEERALDLRGVRLGGEFAPPSCSPLFSSAIVVPYKDRETQLRRFLTYMHAFLRKQNVHYRIYVVEQDDDRPFNRGKLLNIGASIASRHGFPCVILHDVDLLPLKNNNVYACTNLPRHMSSSVDKFRFNLPYEGLFGGAVAILTEQFDFVNGFSNDYFGWGAEDDDLYRRLATVRLKPCRLDPRVSSYVMMKHRQEVASVTKNNLLSTAQTRQTTDGLNSLKYVEKYIKLHPLFTHIAVEL